MSVSCFCDCTGVICSFVRIFECSQIVKQSNIK
uniref:Uncharacterized protein n=1 Tax=Aegilops tauschii subsp. strangulata TaxID=200361 RepID=A0A453LRE3_AEGTS